MDQRRPESDFLARYGAAAFPHRDEVLALIASGSPPTPMSASAGRASDLLEVYRLRVRHIERLLAARDPALDPALGADLLAGCRALVAALEAPDAPADVQIWSARAPDDIRFLVFTDEGTGRVLACVRARIQGTSNFEYALGPADGPGTT